VGDLLLVDKLSYGLRLPFTTWRLPPLRGPSPGDIVAFENPSDPTKVLVKRCIAVAGQTVEVRNKVVYVDGERLPDPPFSKYVDARILPARDPRDNLSPRTISAGSIFVMGDNRDNTPWTASSVAGCLSTGPANRIWPVSLGGSAGLDWGIRCREESGSVRALSLLSVPMPLLRIHRGYR